MALLRPLSSVERMSSGVVTACVSIGAGCVMESTTAQTTRTRTMWNNAVSHLFFLLVYLFVYSFFFFDFLDFAAQFSVYNVSV